MTQPSMQQLIQSANYAAQASREALAAAQRSEANSQAAIRGQQELLKNATQLQQTLAQLAMQRTGGGNPALQYVENIPGRRIPFDLLVNIPIAGSLTSIAEGSITISQDGPFIAVSRFAAFISQYSYQYTAPDGSPSIFAGRSFGRQRPIHSAWDLNDGIPRSEVVQAVAFPGAGEPHIISPSNAASFRTMQPDFRIHFMNAGSSYPRQNLEVPSSIWTKQLNDPFPLGALDVFERGETMTFKIQPQHPTNPAYGNVDSFTGPSNAWPFLASQFDAVEGVSDPVVPNTTSDPVTRLPDGILVIGFHGYRVIQPAGAGPY